MYLLRLRGPGSGLCAQITICQKSGHCALKIVITAALSCGARAGLPVRCLSSWFFFIFFFSTPPLALVVSAAAAQGTEKAGEEKLEEKAVSCSMQFRGQRLARVRARLQQNQGHVPQYYHPRQHLCLQIAPAPPPSASMLSSKR